MISKPFLNFLIVCFWTLISLLIIQYSYFFLQVFISTKGVRFEPDIFMYVVSFVMTFLWIFIFVYSLYFFFKYDKYSKSGVYFFFFHLIYSLIYFYRVIWKRKRELISSYECEPVLGNTIMLETEEIDDIETEELKEKNLN